MGLDVVFAFFFREFHDTLVSHAFCRLTSAAGSKLLVYRFGLLGLGGCVFVHKIKSIFPGFLDY